MSAYMRDVARALSRPGIKIMAVRIVGEDDGLDAISTVALRLAERERAGAPKPAKLDHYVSKAVRMECFKIYGQRKRSRLIDVDDVTIADEPVQTEPRVEIALDRLKPRHASQIRLTYWDEVPVRDEARGVPFGTAVADTWRGKAALAGLEETHEAAHALGLGVTPFEPIDADAWARERARLSRTCAGLQTLELIETWTSLALRRETDLEAVEDWAMRIVGASTEQMDVAEYLIREHWARAGAEVRGAA